MAIKFINLKELFESLILVINLKDYQTLLKSGIQHGYHAIVCMPGVNQIMVYSYGFLFNCTTVCQASDSLMALR